MARQRKPIYYGSYSNLIIRADENIIDEINYNLILDSRVDSSKVNTNINNDIVTLTG